MRIYSDPTPKQQGDLLLFGVRAAAGKKEKTVAYMMRVSKDGHEVACAELGAMDTMPVSVCVCVCVRVCVLVCVRKFVYV